METTSASTGRRQALVTALAAELDRQAHAKASKIDVEALADAVEACLAQTEPTAEGKRPDELNSTNDD